VETEGSRMTSQHGAYALRAGLATLYALMGIHTPTCSGNHMHARTRKHARTDQYVILIAFPQQQWFRERTSVLRYTYIACLAIKGKGKGFSLQAWSGFWGSRRLRLLGLLDFRHYEGCKVVNLTFWPPSPPGVFLVLIFRGWVNPRAHGSVGRLGKNPQRHHWGVDPETFRLVARCLNHYATPQVPCLVIATCI
jgi:hypothetical protein